MNRPLLMILLVLIILGGDVSARGRLIEFSGYTWELRRSNGSEGPGPNRFLPDSRTVSVDEDGLHLRVRERLGVWFCSEATLTQSLGYGLYVFETSGPIDRMDPQVILGMFLYDHDPEYDHREIDIEFGRFGDEDNPNGQFVIQPFEVEANRHRFEFSLDGGAATHAIVWGEDGIGFRSFHGHWAGQIAAGGLESVPGSLTISSWETLDGPPPGNERVHINLWLYQGSAPASPEEITLVSFLFLQPEE